MKLSELQTRTWQTALGVAVSASIALTGCTDAMDDDSTETPDDNAQTRSETTDVDRDGSFLDMADDKGMTKDDPRTRGILQLANTASQHKLDASSEVGLDVRAARNIVDTRETNGSFETLEELDEVPWVSERAFGKMYEYAMNNGYVDGQDGSSDDGSNDDGSDADDGSVETLYGVELGSAEAEAILEVANEESEQTLDSSEEVGLDTRAASNIVDQRPFANLEELDAVAWVSERAFGKLLEWAHVEPDSEQDQPTARHTDTSILLAVANEETEQTLDVEVGIDHRGASAIVDYRTTRGRIDSRDALTSLDYVGATSLRKIREWAADSEAYRYELPPVALHGSEATLYGDAAETLDAFLTEHGNAYSSDAVKSLIDCRVDAQPASCTFESTSLELETSGGQWRLSFDGAHAADSYSTFSRYLETAVDKYSGTDAPSEDGYEYSCHGVGGSTYISPDHFECDITIERETARVTLEGDDATLPQLGADHLWEGWLIVDGQPVSTGHFRAQPTRTEYAFSVDQETADRASKFVLTIEPADEPEGTPSAQKYLAGPLQGDSATISTTAGPTLGGADLSEATGQFFLAAPSGRDNAETDYRNGIWFIDNSGSAKSAGLDLPELGDGWTYEGWVVGEDGPVSTGRFDSPAEADSDRGGPFAGAAGTPPFPGQDFILADGRRDLTDGYKAVITVEPQPDNSPRPFAVKPLAGSIEDAGKGTLQQLDGKDLPEATVTVE